MRRNVALLLLTLAACGGGEESAREAGSTARAAPAGDGAAGTYEIDSSSRFDVHTESAGILGALGHDHVVRAGAFEGRIRWMADAASRSSVRIVVPLHELRVLTDADPDDLREIRAAMEGEVLAVERFPELTFVLTSVSRTETGIRVTGDLTLRGATRSQVVYASLDAAGDTLRAVGSFSVRQTDFGIEPYRAAAGTIAVADEITFDFEVVGVRVREADDGRLEEGPG